MYILKNQNIFLCIWIVLDDIGFIHMYTQLYSCLVRHKICLLYRSLLGMSVELVSMSAHKNVSRFPDVWVLGRFHVFSSLKYLS